MQIKLWTQQRAQKGNQRTEELFTYDCLKSSTLGRRHRHSGSGLVLVHEDSASRDYRVGTTRLRWDAMTPEEVGQTKAGQADHRKKNAAILLVRNYWHTEAPRTRAGVEPVRERGTAPRRTERECWRSVAATVVATATGNTLHPTSFPKDIG
ncbi:hypothetical protein MTO96_029491 [Rhipicephalus appendiculatus]